MSRGVNLVMMAFIKYLESVMLSLKRTGRGEYNFATSDKIFYFNHTKFYGNECETFH